MLRQRPASDELRDEVSPFGHSSSVARARWASVPECPLRLIWPILRRDVRTRYFIRVDPPPDEGAAPRVPQELRQRLLDALSARFEPTLLPHWEAISITSIPTDRAGSDSNKEI